MELRHSSRREGWKKRGEGKEKKAEDEGKDFKWAIVGEMRDGEAGMYVRRRDSGLW